MIFTEEEAKTKRCPFVQPQMSLNPFVHTIPVPQMIYDVPTCRASGCALWAWEHSDRKRLGRCGLGRP